MRVNSALGQVGLSQIGPGQLGPLIDRPGPILSTFFTRDASMRCVLYIKMFSKSLRDNEWFYLYCWSINLVSLNGSDFTTVRETDKKYRLFLVAYFYFPFKHKEKKISGTFNHGSYIFTNILSMLSC